MLMGRNVKVMSVVSNSLIKPLIIERLDKGFALVEMKKKKQKDGTYDNVKITIGYFSTIKMLMTKAARILLERNKTSNVMHIKEYIAEMDYYMKILKESLREH